MANIKSAIKRIRSSERKRVRNQRIRSYTSTSVKKARQLLVEGNKEEAQVAVARAMSALDRAVGRGIVHRNNAARRKSRLVRHLKKL